MAFKMKPGGHPMQKTGGGIPQSMLSRPMMKSGPYQTLNQNTKVGEFGPEVVTDSKTKRQTQDFTKTRTITDNSRGDGGGSTPGGTLTGTTPFGDAFKEARKSGASEFNFKGKNYNTKIKGDNTRQESVTRSVTTPKKVSTLKSKGVSTKGFNKAKPSGELATTGLRKPIKVPKYPAKPKIKAYNPPGTVVSRTVDKIIDGGGDLLEGGGDVIRGATRAIGDAASWVGRGLGRIVPRRRGGASCPSGGF